MDVEILSVCNASKFIFTKWLITTTRIISQLNTIAEKYNAATINISFVCVIKFFLGIYITDA